MLHGITQRRVTLWAVALLAVAVLLGSLLVRTVISPGAQAEAATPIRRVLLDRNGELRSPVGCDTTFTADTLCLDNVFVAHPYLEGIDGIALDRAGNIYAAANQRYAIVVVTPERRVVELFRNPVGAGQPRNQGPLEFPTSPFLTGRRLCITQSDGSRRDNFPNSGGEVAPNTPAVAKISCFDQRLPVAGLPLPVR